MYFQLHRLCHGQLVLSLLRSELREPRSAMHRAIVAYGETEVKKLYKCTSALFSGHEDALAGRDTATDSRHSWISRSRQTCTFDLRAGQKPFRPGPRKVRAISCLGRTSRQCRLNLRHPRHTQLGHLYSQMKQIVQAVRCRVSNEPQVSVWPGQRASRG